MAVAVLAQKAALPHSLLQLQQAKAGEEREQIAKDPGFAPTGDVAAFEINKHDFADVIDVLQAKTGLKVRLESVSH